MSNLKFFELAKEIGITPLALMDKIKEWNLPIKNHLEEIEPEMVEQIFAMLSVKEFQVEEQFTKKTPDYSASVNIALIGKVAAGKSSLLKALLQGTRANKVAKVSAESVRTVQIRPPNFNMGGCNDKVLIIDSPGLNDVKEINSDITKSFVENIDIGIFVVHGPADLRQKEAFEELKSSVKQIFLVLNKIDQLDEYSQSTIDAVKKQWQEYLGCKKIYLTCAFGYDDKLKEGTKLDIRGVDELREDILSFLDSEGKGIHLAKHLQKKSKSV